MNAYHRSFLFRFCMLISLLATWYTTVAQQQSRPFTGKLTCKSAAESDITNAEWLHILTTRNGRRDDSAARLSKTFTSSEAEWYALITSRKATWERMIDSLARPFESIMLDNVTIIAGSCGLDDAFTFAENTIGFDLSILEKNYGNAKSIENTDRIDRLFAHEATHLFHKAWMKSHHLELRTFKDSVLWECIYEGLGTYRSLSRKWLPNGDSLPEATDAALNILLPEFLANIQKVCNAGHLSAVQKSDINRNLSRGAIPKKWGAFTVAIWIAVFVKDDEEKLKTIVEWGLEAPVLLAIGNVPESSTFHLILMRYKQK